MSHCTKYQEVLNVNGIIDRMLAKYSIFDVYNKHGVTNEAFKRLSNDIVELVNTCFTLAPLIDNEYVIERMKTIQEYKQILHDLKKIPVVQQRSEEWYSMRKTLITASDFAQALGEGKFGTQKQLFMKKCGYDIEKFNANSPALKWGVMFEPVACDIYSRRNYVQVFDFGLLRHPTISYFGASPDGINEFGVMLEIKCPYIRKITGEVPTQYYYQIQGQLDVCRLKECDYLECGFQLYTNEKDFWEDRAPYEKGVIIEYKVGLDEQQETKYKYSKLLCGKPADDTIFKEWIERECQETPNVSSIHFWKLDVYYCSRIYKNDEFINDKLNQVGNVWDKIEAYKNDYDLYKAEVSVTRKRSSNLSSTSTATTSTAATINNKQDITGYAFIED